MTKNLKRKANVAELEIPETVYEERNKTSS